MTRHSPMPDRHGGAAMAPEPTAGWTPRAALRLPLVLLAAPEGVPVDHLAAALEGAPARVSLVRGGAAEAAAAVEATQPDVVVAHLDLLVQPGQALMPRLSEAGAVASVVVVAPPGRHGEVMRAIRDGAVAWLDPRAPVAEVTAVLRRAVDLARTWQRVLSRLAEGELDTDEVLRPGAASPAAFDADALRWQPILCPRTGAVAAFEALSSAPVPELPELTPAMQRRFGPRPPAQPTPEFLHAVASELHACAPLPQVLLHIPLAALERSWLGTASDPLRDLADRVYLALDDHRQAVKPQRLGVEVQRLRAEGYRFALTALGAGRDQLAMQLAVQPELFKLGHQTMEGCEVAPRKARHVRALVTLARSGGARVVGEQISTSREARLAMELGCDLLQGPALAPAARAAAWRDGVAIDPELARLVH